MQWQLADLTANIGIERKITKYLSVVSLIPEYSGDSDTSSVYEFIDAINGAAKMGACTDEDKIYAAKLKSTGVAKKLFTGNTELHDELNLATFHRNFQTVFSRYNARKISLPAVTNSKTKAR